MLVGQEQSHFCARAYAYCLAEGCDQGAILFLPIESAGPETPDTLKPS